MDHDKDDLLEKYNQFNKKVENTLPVIEDIVELLRSVTLFTTTAAIISLLKDFDLVHSVIAGGAIGAIYFLIKRFILNLFDTEIPLDIILTTSLIAITAIWLIYS